MNGLAYPAQSPGERAMQRQNSAVMLLQHGPLSLAEFFEISGWKSYEDTWQLLTNLVDVGILEKAKRGVYQMAGYGGSAQ